MRNSTRLNYDEVNTYSGVGIAFDQPWGSPVIPDVSFEQTHSHRGLIDKNLVRINIK